MSRPRAIASAVACATVLCVIGLLGPTGAWMVLVLLPLPGLALGSMYGATAALVFAVLTSLTVGGVLGLDAACFYAAVAGLPLCVTMWAFGRGWRIETVIGLTVAMLITAGAGWLLASYGSLAALRAAVSEAWKSSFDGAMALYRAAGIPEDELADLEMRRTELEQGLLALFPAAVAVTSGVAWFLNLRIASRWASWPQMDDLQHWQAPPWLIWTLIVSGFAMFVPHPAGAVVARNVFVVVLAGYFCQGLTIVSYFLQRLGLPVGLRAASYVLIALQEIVAGMVLALGIFDFWGNFRRIGVHPADADSE